jgi:hypothetical protein
MTYLIVTPYLKGLHLTLASHHLGRNDFGWKMTNQESSAYLQEAVENSQLAEDEAKALEAVGAESILQESSSNSSPVIVPVPPKKIRPVPWLEGDTRTLATLFSKLTPVQTLVRAS